MQPSQFPVDQFCHQMVRFLDALEYDDYNLTRAERVEGLLEVHEKTAEYFTQPLPREVLKRVHPKQIAAVTRTISHFVVYCWSKVPRQAQIDISIYLSIINVLDDEINADPTTQMSTFWTDLLSGKQQKHPFWLLTNAHLPNLLRHYGTFCSFNIMRCTFDYFEGCWIEQHNFQGYPKADCYPGFMRRLNCLGGAVAGTIFPKYDFDDQKLFNELSCIMAQIDGPVAYINDLFSYYKEFDQDEANLVSNWCTVDGINMEQALERLTDETIHACTRIMEVLNGKDAKVVETIRGFIHGYVTWHFCDLRYRLREVYDDASNSAEGVKYREYFDKALETGWVELEEWAKPQTPAQADPTDGSTAQVSSQQQQVEGSHFGGTDVNGFYRSESHVNGPQVNQITVN